MNGSVVREVARGHGRDPLMTAAWPRVRLADVLANLDGRATPVDGSSEYALLGARWYAKGLYVKDRKPGSAIKASTLFRVEEGDFVYNRLFAWKGSFAVATAEQAGCYVSNEFPCFEVNKSRLDPRFLWLYFSQEHVWNEALGFSFGATPTSRNRLKETNLLAMTLPLPMLSEQHRIVAKFDQLSAMVREAEDLRRGTQDEAQALVVACHVSLAGGRALRIGQFLELFEVPTKVLPTGKYPQVGVRSFGGGLFAKPPVGGTETTYKSFNRLYSGAVVLSQVKGWEGAISACPSELDGWFVSPEYRTFRCRPEEADPDYVRAIVSTEWFWSRLQRATRGVGARRERTRPEQFLELEVPWPSVGHQRGVIPMLARLTRRPPLDNHIDRELRALMPAILDRAFKGDL